MPRPLILLSDFGRRDPYVGVVEAGMATLAPAARCIHLTHDVPPQDVRAGSFALAYALPWLPPDAVVWAVVDPGVGTNRRAVAVEGRVRRPGREQRVTIVAPDNGLMTEALAGMEVSAAALLDEPRYHGPGGSATFHGRDVFGPAAAWLAQGQPLAVLGTALDPTTLARIDLPGPQRTSASGIGDWDGIGNGGGVGDGAAGKDRDGRSGWRGTVRWIDRFGDLVTDLPASLLVQGAWVATVGVGGSTQKAGQTAARRGAETRGGSGPTHGATHLVPVGTTFGSVEPGEAVAYGGSWGTVEIAIRDGDAAARFGVGLGARVGLRPAAG